MNREKPITKAIIHFLKEFHVIKWKTNVSDRGINPKEKTVTLLIQIQKKINA